MTYDLSTTTYGHQHSDNGGGVRHQARQVGGEAANAGGNVVQTARDQGQEVVGEAKRQARDLYGEARQQLTTQAGDQQRRAAGGLRSLAEEMRAMAQNSSQAGPVTELAHQAAERVHGVAGWLEAREPGDLLHEVKSYARRNPGTFLVGAALLGVVAGRLAKGLTAESGGPTGPTGGPGYGSADGYDPDRTAVIPTPAPDAVPPGGYLDPTPGTYAEPDPGYSAHPDHGTTTSHADPAGGTRQPLPPVSQTDPLPGVPASGTTRP
ncbi:hypothetical protein [Micromonospora sp. KC213]|uniref:hypothetical protein n=1 Tax=Micromonospora sp. KC213 TaxID=2530378 RepID=UPI001052E102|nr:hypothetical protein [Micromonospora sp. KC213]TDC39441.1 hypothetical protein E1166_16575 [Micromonospora sp. KC213]